ncbi:MAG: hypothetical protein QNJ72_04795 [Pleurocapsa sp. MO_226.B13]|nr:hypothetical protein [Pleurocapsa sp. MO_226.B13]
MKPTQLSQKQLEILNDLDELVGDGLQQIEEFNAESVAMNEKWKKIAETKRSRRQNSKTK